MKVTVMVDSLRPPLSGIGRYCLELCRGLSNRPELELLQFYRNGGWIEDLDTLCAPTSKSPFRRALRRWRQRQNRQKLRETLVHAPNYFLPPEVDSGISTIHDLSVLKYPETHPIARVKQFEREFISSIDRAVHIITDSETIRQELIDSFSLQADRITAVPLGIGYNFRPYSPASATAHLARYSLKPGEYSLCVSTLEPRKRIAELIIAWRDLPAAVRTENQLVIAGPPGWRNEQIYEQISNGVQEGWLRHIGFVEEVDLPALYAGAKLFVYPSTYEGFGLPPLEAMACGTPTLVADQSCLPETCGSAALQVNPNDHDALVAKLQFALTDEEWQRIAVSNGLARAANFSWKRCVDETLSVYQRFWP